MKTHAKVISFRLGEEITTAMDRLFERDGISASEAARRALTAWLTEKGVLSDTPATVATKARHAKRVGAAFVKATRTRAAS